MTKLGKTATRAALAFLFSTMCAASPLYASAQTASNVNLTAVNGLTDFVSISDDREVAGLAAIISGDLEFEGKREQAAAETDSTENVNNQITETEEESTEAAEVKEEKLILTAKVENSLNIRKKPDEESKVTGKLFRGCAAEVIKETEGWYKIQCDDLKGWVSKDYVLTGDEADEFLKEVKPKVATVTAKTLNLRKGKSTDADVVALLEKGEQFMVLGKGKEWTRIRFTTNLEGYVSNDYIEIKKEAGKPVSLKTLNEYVERAEEKEAERAEIAAEAARKAAAEREAAAQREAAQQSAGSSKKASGSSSVKTTQGASYSTSTDNVTLLAAICQYEAGTHYEGCVAVANVVLNRVRSSSYPNNIRDVIYQRGQFGNVRGGALNKILSRGPSSVCVRAAKAALAGTNNVGGRVSFRAARTVNVSSYKNAVVIGGNCFF